jgi:3-keto-disaccharide hydrolase
MSGGRAKVMGIVFLGIVALAGVRAHAQDAGWKELWNGKDFTGWKHVGPGKFAIEKGMLKTVGGMGLLWYTPRKFGDCTIRVVYKTQKKSDNSGLFIRIPNKPTEPWMPVNKGYEVQIDDSADAYHVTGVLYSLTQARANPSETGKWNTMDIMIAGPRTTVTVNGVEVTDYTEGQPVPKKKESYEPDRGPRPNAGYIGLQNHSDKDTVFFKKIEVQPLH